MYSLAKKIARKFGFKLERIKNQIDQSTAAITLSAKGQTRGDVLLSYVIEPFIDNTISNDHSNYWESTCIANTFLSKGFNVDIVSYRNYTFIPKKHYDVFVGARTNFNHLSRYLNKECIKVVHLDTSHWLSNNMAAMKRLIALRNRKGVSISSRKMVESRQAIEVADHATILGNDFTIGTYGFADKAIYRIPLSTPVTYEKFERNFAKCRNNFIWFGSQGFTHKGLDLVIEAFSQMPDKHLFVCGPLDKEPEFVDIYRDELYNLANIHAVGWVDVESRQFKEILRNSIGIVYPSCAEGGGGCVLSCMHGGLIPVVTKEASVDIHESYGVLLNDVSISGIMDKVKRLSNTPSDQLASMSENARNFARNNHTRGSFANTYEKYVDEVLLRSDSANLEPVNNSV